MVVDSIHANAHALAPTIHARLRDEGLVMALFHIDGQVASAGLALELAPSAVRRRCDFSLLWRRGGSAWCSGWGGGGGGTRARCVRPAADAWEPEEAQRRGLHMKMLHPGRRFLRAALSPVVVNEFLLLRVFVKMKWNFEGRRRICNIGKKKTRGGVLWS